MASKKIKSRPNTIPHLNFGISITIRGRTKQLSGISPSPAHANAESLIKAFVLFINQQCGTHYKIVEAK